MGCVHDSARCKFALLMTIVPFAVRACRVLSRFASVCLAFVCFALFCFVLNRGEFVFFRMRPEFEELLPKLEELQRQLPSDD